MAEESVFGRLSNRFAAKEKERKAKQAKTQRRTAKAARAATSNVKDVARGAAQLPVTAYEYLRTSKPMDVARDVGRFAVGIGEDIAADPAGFAAETIMSPIVAARDFAVIREKAAEARAAGDTETADNLEQLAALAVVGGVPIVGRGAKKAVKKGVKEATGKTAKVTEKAFEEMSQRGKLRTDAHNDKTNIKLVLKGDKPATDISIDFDDPKGDALAQRLIKQGLVVNEHPTDPSRAIVAKSAADAERLAKAETNYAMGKAYGYSDDDIARFYRERFGPAAFREWSLDKKDWLKNAKPEGERFSVPAAPKQEVRDFSAMDIDPEFYGLRKTKDFPRLQAAPARFEVLKDLSNPPEVSIADYIGYPFVSTMSDRSVAGQRLVGIGDTDFNFPVDMQGGQDFMFDPTKGGLVWGSASAPVRDIMNAARYLKATTGKNPLFLPFRMAGDSTDHATFTGETMLGYLDATLDASDKKDLNNLIAKYIPNFAGVSSPEGYQQFTKLTGGNRKKIQNMLHERYGEPGGGLTLGMTRAIVADPYQIDKPSYFLQNVGEINPDMDVVLDSGHRTYGHGVPGVARGRLKEQVNVAQILRELQGRYNIGDPRQFRGQKAPRTEEGRAVAMLENEKRLKKSQATGEPYKPVDLEQGATTRYMQSGAKFGILDEDTVRRILEGEY